MDVAKPDLPTSTVSLPTSKLPRFHALGMEYSKANLIHESVVKTVIEYLELFATKAPTPFNNGPTFSITVFMLLTYTAVETFTALHITCQLKDKVAVVFLVPSWTLALLDNLYIFLISHLSLFLAPICFLVMFEYSQEFVDYP